VANQVRQLRLDEPDVRVEPGLEVVGERLGAGARQPSEKVRTQAFAASVPDAAALLELIAVSFVLDVASDSGPFRPEPISAAG
jgi:hypothetical protein